MASRLNPDYLEIPELASNPATPSAGNTRFFVKTDGTVNVILDDATVIDLTSAGSTTLDALTDTNLSSLQNGQYLKYVTPPGEWQNATPVINDMDDVNVSLPQNGEALVYNSGTGDWENQTVSASSSLAALTDTTLTTPAQGDVLVRGASDWVNLPYNPTVHSILPHASAITVSQSSSVVINIAATGTTLHESVGSTGTLTNFVVPTTVFRTPVGADSALGLITGFFTIDTTPYTASSDVVIAFIDQALNTSLTTTGGTILLDQNITAAGLSGLVTFTVSVPIYGGSAPGARQYYFYVEETGSDDVDISWSLTATWFENQ